jgi:acyl-CoA thioesterase FadM
MRPWDGHTNDSSGMIIVTANLTVNFRAPFLAGSEAVIRVYHNETKGRKIYFSARLESKDGRVVFAEASSLFVLARKDKLRMKER